MELADESANVSFVGHLFNCQLSIFDLNLSRAPPTAQWNDVNLQKESMETEDQHPAKQRKSCNGKSDSSQQRKSCNGKSVELEQKNANVSFIGHLFNCQLSIFDLNLSRAPPHRTME